MPEMSEEQKKAIEEQKKQCPFCQIIVGKIPAKKIYEDDKVIVVLDINPASKGHVLVMPKEHYPIMPLIPKETFGHLFKIVRDISKMLKKSMLMTGTHVFIANGAVAGQQSGHFMVHVIPREEGDSFKALKFKSVEVDDAKLKELEGMLKHNLPLMLKDFYAKHPIEGKSQAIPKMDKAAVIKVIEANKQILDLIKSNPDGIKKAIPMNPQLQALFKDVSFDEIVEHFTGEKVAEFEDLDNISKMIEAPKAPEKVEEKSELDDVAALLGGDDEEEVEPKEDIKDSPKKVKKNKKEEEPEDDEDSDDNNLELDDVAALLGGASAPKAVEEEDPEEESEAEDDSEEEPEDDEETEEKDNSSKLDDVAALLGGTSVVNKKNKEDAEEEDSDDEEAEDDSDEEDDDSKEEEPEDDDDSEEESEPTRTAPKTESLDDIASLFK